MMTAEERWHRIAIAGIFVLELIVQINAKDFDGILMSLIPIGVALIGWRLALWRRNQLAQ